MTLNPKKSPTIFAMLCGGLVLLVAAWLPLWETFSYYEAGKTPPWDAVHTQVLEMAKVRSMYSNGPPSFVPGLNEFDRNNLLLAALLLTAGTITGRLFYWYRWERFCDETP